MHLLIILASILRGPFSFALANDLLTLRVLFNVIFELAPVLSIITSMNVPEAESSSPRIRGYYREASGYCEALEACETGRISLENLTFRRWKEPGTVEAIYVVFNELA
jgi:hypothetical protein